MIVFCFSLHWFGLVGSGWTMGWLFDIFSGILGIEYVLYMGSVTKRASKQAYNARHLQVIRT